MRLGPNDRAIGVLTHRRSEMIERYARKPIME